MKKIAFILSAILLSSCSATPSSGNWVYVGDDFGYETYYWSEIKSSPDNPNLRIVRTLANISSPKGSLVAESIIDCTKGTAINGDYTYYANHFAQGEVTSVSQSDGEIKLLSHSPVGRSLNQIICNK